jgi:hypothetical protein
VNEHLGNILPSFKELAGSGNALERVLALELELAEALQEKKRTDTRFQRYIISISDSLHLVQWTTLGSLYKLDKSKTAYCFSLVVN